MSALQQGETDGLCGIYALANFVLRKQITASASPDKSVEAFRQLIEATEQVGLLSAYRILQGFEWPELKRIFNFWSTEFEVPYRAHSLMSISRGLSSLDSKTVIRNVVGRGGGCIVSTGRGKHWILVESIDSEGSFEQIDSSKNYRSGPVKQFDSMAHGLAILPHEALVLEN